MSREEANRIARAAERLRRSRRLGLRVGLPTAAAFGAGAALAIGAIPGGDGTISGCYVTNTDVVPGGAGRFGELRVVDPSLPHTLPQGQPNQEAVCLNGEAPITWNQRGPEGPVGPAGPQGPAGAGGAQGANGANGANGTPLIGQTTFGFSGGGKTFLKLGDIKGESTDKDHKDWIEISSFSFSASSSGGGGGAGSGAASGKQTISSFTITKKLDKASPLLFQAAAGGKHIKLADVAFARKAGRGQHEYLVIKMSDVLISSVQQGSGGGGTPSEQVTLNFAKATETFFDAQHKALQTVTINVGQNKKA